MSDQLMQQGIIAAQKTKDNAFQQRLARLKQNLRPKKNQEKELRKACADFEAIFIQKLWEQMRATVPKEGYLHSKEEDIYLSLYDQELSTRLAKRGGLGLGDLLFSQLQKRLEKSSAETDPGAGPVNELKRSQPQLKTSNTTNKVRPVEKSIHELKDALEHESDPLKKVDILARRIEARSRSGKGGLSPLQESLQIDPVKNINIDTGPLPQLHWPVQAHVSSGFGWRLDPFTGQQAWHAGIDLVVSEGTPIEACWPGKVVFSGSRGGYGQVVILEHKNGWQSIYAHNTKNLVREGEFVRSGQRIALSGNTGRSTGPHVHFELRQNDQAWNPLQVRKRLLAGLSIGKEADKA